MSFVPELFSRCANILFVPVFVDQIYLFFAKALLAVKNCITCDRTLLGLQNLYTSCMQAPLSWSGPCFLNIWSLLTGSETLQDVGCCSFAVLSVDNFPIAQN